MSALNDSRNISGQADYSAGKSSSAYQGIQANVDNAFDAAYTANTPQRSDVFHTIENQICTLRQIAERHERQIVTLAADKHDHCEHLATVYEQLKKTLEKFKFPSLTTRDGKAGLQAGLLASLSSGSSFPGNDDPSVYTVGVSSNKLASSSPRRRLEEKLDELLSQHRDQVYDVLADYRKQIDKSERETKRRLDAMERSIALIQGEVKELHHLLSNSETARESAEDRLREEVRVVAKQQEAQRVAFDKATNEHMEKVQRCCDDLSACLAQLDEEAKSIKKQQQRSEKEFGRQIRSVVETEKHFAEVLEQQSRSINKLDTQDSLVGAFHEVKDWLSDLEKRMVSRGELLKWTESLQQEISVLRRVGGHLTGNGDTLSSSGLKDQ